MVERWATLKPVTDPAELEAMAKRRAESEAEDRLVKQKLGIGLDFGDAVSALKVGKRVARSGWNGKGMWLGLVKSEDISFRGSFSPVGLIPGQLVPLLPWIGMKTATGEFVPWLASQTDVLAEDWSEVTYG